MKYYKIGKISKMLGVTPTTIRTWYKEKSIVEEAI
jgi:DNA-binding transcriptional MerR regulator